MSASSFIKELKNWPDRSRLRRGIFSGDIFRAQFSVNAARLAEAVGTLLGEAFPEAPSPTLALGYMQPDEFFRRLNNVRQELEDGYFVARQLDLLTEAGFERDENYIDKLRLRAVIPREFVTPGMKTAYSLHRDCWYANPYAQINWWLAIYPVERKQSFAFYPECFLKAVPNNSSDFDYREFMEKAGWQRTGGVGTSAVYPTVTGRVNLGPTVRFELAQGGLLLFSAAQLHATRLNHTSFCRFSLDFRTVAEEDIKLQVAAINIDGSSQGNAMEDYMSPCKEPMWT